MAKIVKAKLSDIKPDANNANLHTERGTWMVNKSLSKLGGGRGILLDKNNKIVAGNLTVEQAVDIGLEKLVIVDTDGDTIVATRRTDYDLDDPHGQARQMAYADNRAATVSIDIDPERVVLDFDAGVELGDWFQDFELAEFGIGDDPPEDVAPQIDRADELRQKWGVESGQLWQLGDHRVICGDCTDGMVISSFLNGDKADCIVTDPPYGVSYDGGTTKRDELSGDSSPALYLPALACWKSICADHVALYLWYADGDQAVSQAVSQAGFVVRRNLIWNKNQAQYGALSQQYKQKHEPFFYAHLKGKSPYWAGDATEITVWNIDRESTNDLHPTQKPAALFERAIKNSSKIGDLIFDGFLGSGTTLIACERLSRKCYGVEIEPKYVAVTLQRWADVTGREPVLIE